MKIKHLVSAPYGAALPGDVLEYARSAEYYTRSMKALAELAEDSWAAEHHPLLQWEDGDPSSLTPDPMLAWALRNRHGAAFRLRLGTLQEHIMAAARWDSINPDEEPWYSMLRGRTPVETRHLPPVGWFLEIPVYPGRYTQGEKIISLFTVGHGLYKNLIPPTGRTQLSQGEWRWRDNISKVYFTSWPTPYPTTENPSRKNLLYKDMVTGNPRQLFPPSLTCALATLEDGLRIMDDEPEILEGLSDSWRLQVYEHGSVARRWLALLFEEARKEKLV